MYDDDPRIRLFLTFMGAFTGTLGILIYEIVSGHSIIRFVYGLLR